jgi:acyl carrier protein
MRVEIVSPGVARDEGGEMSVVAKGVTEIIAVKAKRDPAELQRSEWLDELGIESLGVIEMIFELEDRFGIEIPVNANTAGKEFKTVGDIVLIVEKLVAAKDAA